MLYPRIELPAYSGTIDDNNTLTKDLPRGRRLRSLELTSLRASDVAQTRTIQQAEMLLHYIRANGHPLVHELSTKHLHDLMNYAGAAGADGAADDGKVRVSFVDPSCNRAPLYTPKGVITGESLAIGCVGLDSLEHEVRLGTMDASNPMVKLVSQVTQGNVNQEPGLVRRYIRVNESGWATAKKGLTITARRGEIIRRIHITGYGSGVLKSADVNERVLKRQYKAWDFARIPKEHGFTPQSGYYHLELGERGHVLDGLDNDPSVGPGVELEWSTEPDNNQFVVIYDVVTHWWSLAGLEPPSDDPYAAILREAA